MRIGLVGEGNIGQLRANAIRKSNLCDLTAVADIDLQRAAAMAKASGAVAHADFREMLAAGTVDAIIVSTPPPFHEEIVIAALEGGIQAPTPRFRWSSCR